MKKKLPKTVKILGKTIKVKEVDSLESAGVFWLNTLTILISRDQTEESKLTTLHHEIFHAVLGISGLSKALGEDLEEAVVQSFEQALWGVMELK